MSEDRDARRRQRIGAIHVRRGKIVSHTNASVTVGQMLGLASITVGKPSLVRAHLSKEKLVSLLGLAGRRLTAPTPMPSS